MQYQNGETEQHLTSLSDSLGVVIIRPPLVYGPGVGGNFRRLASLLHTGVPLPLGSITNARSMISIWNLVDLIELCLRHPAARGHTFLASDGEDLSTPDLLNMLGAAIGHPARLLPCPVPLLRRLSRAVGRDKEFSRLSDSLQVDSSLPRNLLGWRPPQSTTSGIELTGASFRSKSLHDVQFKDSRNHRDTA